MLTGRGHDRLPLVIFVSVSLLAVFVFLSGRYHSDWYDAGAEQIKAKWSSVAKPAAAIPGTPVSYDLSRPPTVGCEDLVSRLQLRLIEAYTIMFRGIRYANIWGYLESENKGDAAIWAAQQMMFATLGIQYKESCRFIDKDCNVESFNKSLTDHHPYSAIVMAGGGNFNDFYWEDQPSRIKMVKAFPETPIRMFPQSVYMTHEDRITMTKESFGAHPDLMLAARDRPSWEWLDENLEKAVGVPSVLVPDIAFMWGNRPDFRTNTQKTHDILILARKDSEISAGDSRDMKYGYGHMDLGGKIGNVSYNKVDWKFTHTPGIDKDFPGNLFMELQLGPDAKPNLTELFSANHTEEDMLYDKLDFGTLEQQQRGADLMYKEYIPARENNMNARAWAKAVAGFQLLGSAKFIITDRLHGHIMSTVIGTPHVLMDSKLGKNLNLHDTWTQDCDCVRIANNMTQALDVARMYFEENGL